MLKIFRQQACTTRYERRLRDQSIPEGELKPLAQIDSVEDQRDVDLYCTVEKS